MVKVSIISALSDNYVIGNKGDLPWHIPEDFKLFVQITKGKPVIMGRKTWDSLPKKPLPGRLNIVVSRDSESVGSEALVSESLPGAIELACEKQVGVEEVMILGGAQIYKQALESGIVDTLYLSHISGHYSGDAYFPKFNKKEFKIIEEKDFDKFVFREYERV